MNHTTTTMNNCESNLPCYADAAIKYLAKRKASIMTNRFVPILYGNIILWNPPVRKEIPPLITVVI